MRPTEYYTVLGDLIDSVLTCMIDYVEDLYDISEEESHQLSLICTMLFRLEDLFNKKEVRLLFICFKRKLNPQILFLTIIILFPYRKIR